MQQNQPQGSKFLLIAGILFIAGSFFYLAGLSLGNILFWLSFPPGFHGMMWLWSPPLFFRGGFISLLTGILPSIFFLVAGIIGIANSNKPNQANALKILGWIAFGLSFIPVISLLLRGFWNWQFTIDALFSLVSRLGISVLFIMGASQNAANIVHALCAKCGNKLKSNLMFCQICGTFTEKKN